MAISGAHRRENLLLGALAAPVAGAIGAPISKNRCRDPLGRSAKLHAQILLKFLKDSRVGFIDLG